MDTSPPPVLPPPVSPKPGPLLLIGTTVIVLLNMWLGFAKEIRATGNISQSLGAATAQFVIPVIVAVLFSLTKRFRNARSRTKVVLWTSVVVFLATLGSLGRK